MFLLLHAIGTPCLLPACCTLFLCFLALPSLHPSFTHCSIVYGWAYSKGVQACCYSSVRPRASPLFTSTEEGIQETSNVHKGPFIWEIILLSWLPIICFTMHIWAVLAML